MQLRYGNVKGRGQADIRNYVKNGKISIDTMLQCGIVILDMIFIESSSFTKAVYEYLSDEGYKDLQTRLVDQPHLGKVIPGCGGIQKIRWAQKGKLHGKRGGVRVFYLYIEELSHIHLLAILEKGKKEDLSPKEKETLKILAVQLKNLQGGYYEKEDIIYHA